MMKCKNCGGSLIYSEGIYICESCGSRYTVEDFYKNIDTYICYIESDGNGRRTKDSIIAQDIYQKLESNKIKTFYSRISADSLIGDELEQVCNAAIHTAKTILVLGTQKQYFEGLLEKYSSYFSGKIVIPIYADMDAYAIPKGISAIQALDYNKVGATVDLAKSLLNALGREQETNFIEISKKSASRKKKMLLIGISITVIALIVLFFFLGYSKEREKNIVNQEETALSQEEIQRNQYNEGMSCVENGDFVKAIELFSTLGDYQDSQKQLLLLHEKYAGYYKNDEQNITFHLQIWEGSTAGIEISAIAENGTQCSISETSQFRQNKLELEFNDSENNKGNITIELRNDELNLVVKTTDKVSDISIGTVECAFLISEKSDKPFKTSLDKETLMGFVNSRVTLSKLKQMGLEVEFVSALYKDTGSSRYKIKDTEIELAIYNYDISKTDEYYGDSETKVEDPVVFAVSAPASIIAPEKIGQSNEPFMENDILYVPNSQLSQDYHVIDFWIQDTSESDAISNNTSICFTSKSLIGDKHFNELVLEYLVIQKAKDAYATTYSVAWVLTEVEEYEEYYIVYASDSKGASPTVAYRIYKETYKIEQVTE